MATRLNRKNASTTSAKEIVPAERLTTKNDPNAEGVSKPGVGRQVKNTSIVKRIAKKSPPKKILKKPSIAIKMKAKSKKAVKLNQNISKVFRLTAKQKEKIMNSVIRQEPRKRKTAIKKEKDDSPPVLEPIFPIEENIETKKQAKKRLPKKSIKKNVDLLDPKKIKVENDDNISVSSDVTDISIAEIPTLPKQVRKPRASKKPKVENDSLEDVMNDLSYLIKGEDVKREVEDSMSESGKSDTTIKTKKLTKRQRIEQLKKKILKKENLENTLSKLDFSDEKVIDTLDLNVRKTKKKSPLAKRRHSIEKFPIGPMETSDVPIPQLSPFNSLPRSVSPRPKRNAKVRQSVEGVCRRSSPYTTRSDSPARMLRNGKQRKLKDMNLLEGLDTENKKRRRLCSDLSGSEMSVSKLSGYESDSSFSDLASLHGGENNDSKDVDMKCVNAKEVFAPESDVAIPALIKRTASSETAANGPNENIRLIDTNSNLCNNLNVNPVDINLNDKKEIKQEVSEDSTLYSINPSIKVPEKSIILDIMKQTFNDENCVKTVKRPERKTDLTTESVVVSKFYGKSPQLALNSDVTNSKNDEAAALSTDEMPELTMQVLTEEISNFVEEPIEHHLNSEKVSVVTENECHEIIEENSTAKDDKEVQDTNVDLTKNEEVESEKVLDPTEDAKSEEIKEINSEVVTNLSLDLEQDSESESALKIREINQEIEPTTKPLAEEQILEENCVANMTDLSEQAAKEDEENSGPSMAESAEELAEKENILKALGLQSLRAAEEAKQKTKEKPASKSDSYTGTLKTVIKINRDKKKGRNSFKMTLQKNKGKAASAVVEQAPNEENYEIMKEGTSAAWKQGSQSSDTADGSSEHTSDGEAPAQDGSIKALVIPEKASSFSIHPGRLCKDECSYCFGKFGLFDTPCHIAQMKSVERQNKILATEKHLTRDSCLCDACYRHVDRKSNTPSYTNKSLKRNSLVAPGPRQNHCHVLGCNKVSSNILRRKWIIKMRKSICQVINIDLDNPGLHSIPICDEHYSALEHLMICAMCKRRLARNHIHYLGPETGDLNNALKDEGIPLMLTDKPVVCKLCKCFASIILKDPEERPENSTNFFKEYKRRLLHFNDIVPMDEAAAEEPISVPSKTDRIDQLKKKTKKLGKNSTANDSASQNDSQDASDFPEKIQERVPSTDTSSQPQSRSESPSDEYNSVDYTTLIPAIAMDCGSDTESKKEPPRKAPVVIKKIPRIESIKEAVEISKVIKVNSDKCKSSDVVVQKLGSNPSISVRQLFPGEEDLPLSAHVDFSNVKDRTPEGWEKCCSTIQYDGETKRLWQELQKPYGNQSSFMRHLILLEKYFRNGDLILSPTASHHSINYSESVHNRLRAYDNIPTSAGNIQPISMIPFNKMQKSSSGIITSANVSLSLNTSTSTHSSVTSLGNNSAVSVTSITNNVAKNTPLTLSQLNSPPLIPAGAVLQQVRPKMVGAPPGLISLHPGTTRPIAPLVKVPQSQKIKFPITKNWRPNLIPIDPTKKQERKAGLVQVISGGKPYHITLEDYKKMCAIKRSFEMKQKRLQEAQHAKPILVTHNSVLKSITPRKGLIISKTPTGANSAKGEIVTPQSDNGNDGENILEKLDKQVEKLESKLNEKPSSLLLPKIPKSLTVIPQTVTRKSRPSSPALLITPKGTANKS
ncbi:uncharacterized protein LOC108912008 isoform X2 [Anoplophora glabripennis]|uniref:uncharacterized protein LOC108912008 isoform X2 n=1 Tax=Anoplophora glabripennis TaxID=217634 RepID=UPI000874199A|nr:uncharacterized protein LOC108912008 isoform X2 [Anoplophora glabripennis]